MTLEEAIVQQLKNYAPLAALVGTRIYPATYPQNATMPLCVYQRTSKAPDYTHDGPSGNKDSRFQISSFGHSFSDARHTADEIFEALRPWANQQTVINDLRVGACFMEDELDIYNPADVESQSLYQVLGDYLFLEGDA